MKYMFVYVYKDVHLPEEPFSAAATNLDKGGGGGGGGGGCRHPAGKSRRAKANARQPAQYI